MAPQMVNSKMPDNKEGVMVWQGKRFATGM